MSVFSGIEAIEIAEKQLAHLEIKVSAYRGDPMIADQVNGISQLAKRNLTLARRLMKADEIDDLSPELFTKVLKDEEVSSVADLVMLASHSIGGADAILDISSKMASARPQLRSL